MVLSIFAVFEELTMSTELRHKSALQNIYLRRENEQTNSPLPPFLSHRRGFEEGIRSFVVRQVALPF